jgi:hypothetical protein
MGESMFADGGTWGVGCGDFAFFAYPDNQPAGSTRQCRSAINLGGHLKRWEQPVPMAHISTKTSTRGSAFNGAPGIERLAGEPAREGRNNTATRQIDQRWIESLDGDHG